MNSVTLLAGDRLRVVFDFRGDRWGHRIEWPDGRSWIAGLSSIEGTAADAWPPSPAFQTLDLPAIAGPADTALLVGKAGASHWSAAITADPVAKSIGFDIACRVGKSPHSLGSRYLVGCDSIGAGADSPRISSSDIAGGCRSSIVKAGGELAIRVSSDAIVAPCTIRWQYVVSLPE